MRFPYKEVLQKEKRKKEKRGGRKKRKELRLIDATVFYVQCKNLTKIDFSFFFSFLRAWMKKTYIYRGLEVLPPPAFVGKAFGLKERLL